MTDEKIIYLGPEEELTSVRERLEKIDAGRIMLVIPPQTQLRSHVGWRLLHSRMRELGKDVLVISSDRQIRAVAKAAGFRVADSQESPPSARTRPSSHPSRSGIGGRTSPRSRNLPGKGSPENRAQRPHQQPDQPRVATNDRQHMQQTQHETSSGVSRADEMISGSAAGAASTYGVQNAQFRSPSDLHIDTSPSIRPLVPGQVDDELDTLTADFNRAQSIREAAQSTGAGAVSPAPATREPSSSIPRQASKTPPAGIEVDPFAYMDDHPPTSLREQRGSTHIEDIDSGIPDISDVPTDVFEHQIEDMGDEGAVVFQQDSLPHAWPEPVVEEPGRAETPRVYGTPPRNSRMGKPAMQDIDDGEKLLPVADQPTRITPSPSAAVRSPAMPIPSTVGNRGPQPILQPQARNVSTTPAPPKTKKPAKAGRPAAPPASRRASLTPGRKTNRIVAIVSVSVVILVLAALAFIILGSNATVTIVVPTQPLSLPNLQYVASTNPNDTIHNTIPSQVLTHTFTSAPGQGTATGVTQQGNTNASGTVIFTNKGKQSVDIPTGTVIQTGGPAAVQFITTANPSIPPFNSSLPNPPVPVQAQSPGTSGNVPANTINVIPADSITQIAKWNNIAPTAVNVSVTNPDATSGGGAANVKQVTSNDANTLAKALHPDLQKQITSWLATELHQGDVRGKLIPDVVDSPTPLLEETLMATPQVGRPSANGKFTGVLSVSVKILVIRAATIQAVSQAQLNTNAMKLSPAFVLVTQRLVIISKEKVTPSADGTTLSLSWTATGQIMQQVSAQQAQHISNVVAGKGVDQARSDITNGGAGITGVADTRIDVFPPFLSIMPLRAEQIHVIVQPGLEKGTPNG